MAEVGRELRQEPLHVGPLTIPGSQPIDGEGMPERMEARRLDHRVCVDNLGVAKQALERARNGLPGQPSSIHGGEEERVRPVRKGPRCAQLRVPPELGCELRSHREPTALVELRIAYGELRFREVDIPHTKRPRLPTAKPRAVEEKDEHAQRARIEAKRAPSAGGYGVNETT